MRWKNSCALPVRKPRPACVRPNCGKGTAATLKADCGLAFSPVSCHSRIPFKRETAGGCCPPSFALCRQSGNSPFCGGHCRIGIVPHACDDNGRPCLVRLRVDAGKMTGYSAGAIVEKAYFIAVGDPLHFPG